MKPIRSILFVCTGNACRSPMAEAIARQRLLQKGVKNIKVFSRGTHAAAMLEMAPHAGWVLTEAQIPIEGHRPRQLTRKDVQQAGLILGMAREHVAAALQLAPGAYTRTFLLQEYANQVTREVADPIGRPLNEFRRCRDELTAAIDNLIPKLASKGADREKRVKKARPRSLQSRPRRD